MLTTMTLSVVVYISADHDFMPSFEYWPGVGLFDGHIPRYLREGDDYTDQSWLNSQAGWMTMSVYLTGAG